jgi:hypothetical protein
MIKDFKTCPINLEKFEFIMHDPDEPDKDGFYKLYFDIIDCETVQNNYFFTFVRKENEDWKFQGIAIMVNFLP